MRTLLVVAVALAGLLSACSGDTGRFFIVQNQVPQAGCVVTTERTVYQGEGVLDISLVDEGSAFAYELFPLIQNDYPTSGTPNAPEPNRLFVRAFRVRIEAGAGAPQKIVDLFDRLTSSAQSTLVDFQQPWAATIDPGGGLLAAAVGVIPGELARQLRATKVLDASPSVSVMARVRAVGQRRDGEVESQEFVFPISICQDCLVANLRMCPYTPVNLGNACNVAQDAMVDCCFNGGQRICPATAPAK
jgi:hypothetical protein